MESRDVHHHAHNILSLVPVLSQLRKLASNFFKIYSMLNFHLSLGPFFTGFPLSSVRR